MSRKDFQKICYEVVSEAEKEFFNLFNSIALSVDWSLSYQTIGDHAMKISQMSFLDMFKKNEVYRAFEPTLWDCVDKTALAQADVEDKEQKGVMNHITFATNSGEEVTIATSRPELLPACVAVFFHPDDQRFKHLKGALAITPLFNEQVPFIPDESVDIEKGSGLVMCCTFGDITDVHWWKKYKLPLKIIIDPAGKVNLPKPSGDQEVDECFAGNSISETRKKVMEILQKKGYLTKQEELIRSVKCAERSGAPIEILVAPQWFIKVLDKKDALLEKANRCNWHPKYMKTRLENWINGLSWDWCISRQRFFGVPFPVWYSKRPGEEGKVIVADVQDLPLDPLRSLPRGYEEHEVEPDKDVMDTWATSSLTPQICSSAINQDFAIDFDKHKKLFPADLRSQAHEIIRTWAFTTIVKAHIHENNVPWSNLMISGWCLAADKTKMSKSKGNVVTPIALIEEKGTDVVRYWASTSKLGADIAYSENVFEIGKKFVNKLWNASKFVSMQISSINNSDIIYSNIICDLDKWILNKLNNLIVKATKELNLYEYSSARHLIEEFFWKDFCDNYLELVKVRSYDQDGQNPLGKRSAQISLHIILDILLRMLAPFVPHITEELYAAIFDAKKHLAKDSIHSIGTWPKAFDEFSNFNMQGQGDEIIELMDAVRQFKAKKQISIKAPLESINIYSDTFKSLENSDAVQDFKNAANAQEVKFIDKATLPSAYEFDITESASGKFLIEIKQS
jgi:valyl-tRNA synthetase